MTRLFRQPQMFKPAEERAARQTWRTPIKLFMGLTARYAFRLDAAADASNFKCDRWLGEEDDAPECRWVDEDGNPVPTWWNPPFSSGERWAVAAARERKRGTLSVGLVCAPMNNLWWIDKALPHCEFWTFRGRVQYVPPPGITKSSNDRDSILMVFDPEGPTNSFGGVLCPSSGRIIRRAS